MPSRLPGLRRRALDGGHRRRPAAEGRGRPNPGRAARRQSPERGGMTPLAARLERLAPLDPRRAVVDELRARLRRLEERAPPASNAPARLPPGDIYHRATPRPLRGLESAVATSFGASFSTEMTRVGAVRLTRAEIQAPAARVAAELAGLDAVPPDLLRGVCVLDLETTGLAGGTGTLAFLVGLGRFDDAGRFSVEQLLLGSPAHEPAMLDALEAVLAGVTLLVSFNGRSFDVPLLRTRCV